MAREGFAQHALEVRTGVVLHALHDAFVTQELQVRDSDSGSHRMARVGETMIELTVLDDCLRHAIVQSDCAHRHVAAGQPLGHRDEVGFEAEVLMREPLAGAAETTDHFISDQQYVVLAADALDLRPVS